MAGLIKNLCYKLCLVCYGLDKSALNILVTRMSIGMLFHSSTGKYCPLNVVNW